MPNFTNDLLSFLFFISGEISIEDDVELESFLFVDINNVLFKVPFIISYKNTKRIIKLHYPGGHCANRQQ